MLAKNLIRVLLVIAALGLVVPTLACDKGEKGGEPAAAEAKKAPEAKKEIPQKMPEPAKKAITKKMPTPEKQPIARKMPAVEKTEITKKLPAAAVAKAAPAKEEPVTEGKKAEGHPIVVIETSLGNIEVELFEDKAPISVANFLSYVDDKFYDGTIFHRVIAGFMIQGGGYTADFQKKPTKDPIKNEATNGLKNKKYTLAMARTGVVDSATAQFFINVVDNAFLDHRSPDPRGYGYAVFGQVVAGQDVVDKIKAVPTGRGGPFPKDVPQTEMLIKSIRRK